MVCVQAYDQHLNMILGEVEETLTTVEIDDETYEEIIKVRPRCSAAVGTQSLLYGSSQGALSLAGAMQQSFIGAPGPRSCRLIELLDAACKFDGCSGPPDRRCMAFWQTSTVQTFCGSVARAADGRPMCCSCCAFMGSVIHPDVPGRQ